jgi:hypothetical protein
LSPARQSTRGLCRAAREPAPIAKDDESFSTQIDASDILAFNRIVVRLEKIADKMEKGCAPYRPVGDYLLMIKHAVLGVGCFSVICLSMVGVGRNHSTCKCKQ